MFVTGYKGTIRNEYKTEYDDFSWSHILRDGPSFMDCLPISRAGLSPSGHTGHAVYDHVG